MKTAARQLSRASRGAWLDGEVAGDVAELLGAAVGRGVAGGHGGEQRRRRLVRWCSREREKGEGMSTAESEGSRGGCVATRQGVAEQAGRQEVAGRMAACGERMLGVLLARWRRRLALLVSWAGLLGRWAA